MPTKKTQLKIKSPIYKAREIRKYEQLEKKALKFFTTKKK
jgi:hypothetical protein